jgi:hypothetical protein
MRGSQYKELLTTLFRTCNQYYLNQLMRNSYISQNEIT